MEVAQIKCHFCEKEIRLSKNLKDRLPKRETYVTDEKNIINERVLTTFCIYIYNWILWVFKHFG